MHNDTNERGRGDVLPTAGWIVVFVVIVALWAMGFAAGYGLGRSSALSDNRPTTPLRVE